MGTINLSRQIAGKIEQIEDVRYFTKVPAIHLLLDHYTGLIADHRNPVPSYNQFHHETLGEDICNVAVFKFGNDGPAFQFVGEKISDRFEKSPVGVPYKDFIPENRIESALKSSTIVSRHFVDLGFGVPTTHVDLVGTTPSWLRSHPHSNGIVEHLARPCSLNDKSQTQRKTRSLSMNAGSQSAQSRLSILGQTLT